jgi:hypothetical protein
MSMGRRRPGCPINLTLEPSAPLEPGRPREIMFRRNRTFSSLLTDSAAGIASDILADRLQRLTESGLLSRCCQ